MSGNFSFDIPYLIWAIVCIVIILVIVIFCIYQLRKYCKRSRETRDGCNANSVVTGPPLFATVLVNSVSDTEAAEQQAAALATIGNGTNYAYSAVQPSNQEQNGWYLSQHAQTTRGADVREALPPLAGVASDTPAVVQASSSQRSDVELEQRVGGNEGGVAVLSSGSPLHHTSQHDDIQIADRRDSSTQGRSNISAQHFLSTRPQQQRAPAPLSSRNPEEPHAFVSHQSNSMPPSRPLAAFPVAANPIPLGILNVNPLAPASAATTARQARNPYLPVSQQPTTDVPSSTRSSLFFLPFRFSFPWTRARRAQRQHPHHSQVDVASGGDDAERLDDVVEGYCCDEHGNRLTVQQAEDIYGNAAYITRATPPVVVADGVSEYSEAASKETMHEVEHVESSASVFSFYPLSSTSSHNTK